MNTFPPSVSEAQIGPRDEPTADSPDGGRADRDGGGEPRRRPSYCPGAVVFDFLKEWQSRPHYKPCVVCGQIWTSCGTCVECENEFKAGLPHPSGRGV